MPSARLANLVVLAGGLYATNVTAQTGNFQTTNASTTHTNKLNAQQLCIADNANDPNPVCVTKAQLAALLSAAATPATSISVSSSASNSSGASAQNPSPDLTNSGNPNNENSSSASSSSTATARQRARWRLSRHRRMPSTALLPMR